MNEKLMSKEPKDEPAFPQECEVDPRFSRTFSGLSMRDWFAGQALMSMLGTPMVIRDEDYATAAKLSYRFADAMLAERSKPKT